MALLGFVLVEPRVRHPILDFGLFRSRVFASGTISLALSFTSIFAVGFVMPFYLEELRHFPTGTSGLLLTPYTIVIALVALPSGALADRFGTRWLAAGGMTIACVGLVLLGSLDASAPKADVIWRLGLTGLGQGMFQALNNSAILGAVPANRQGAASGILATGRVVGQCLSVAIAGAVFSSLGGASAGRALAVDRHDEGPFREGLQNSPISDLHHIGEFSPAPSQGATAKCAVLAVASATAAAGAMCWRKTRVVWRASLDKAPLGMAGTRL